MSATRRQAWEGSYQRLENHLFWPSEEVVRFLSRYVRRRIGPSEFSDVMSFSPEAGHPARALDLGCGIGRHMLLLHEFRLEPYGIDLSETAVDKARAWLTGSSAGLAANVVVGGVTRLPWEDEFFSVVVSHAVLDSVPFEVAEAAAREVERVLAPGGYFYCDLIAFDQRNDGRPIEIEVDGDFERGTVQSYFDEARLDALFAPRFSVAERTLVTHQTLPDGPRSGRWHLVLRKSRPASMG